MRSFTYVQTIYVSIGKDFVCFSPGIAYDSGCVVLPDVKAKNGIAHVIDAVLMPYYYSYGIAELAKEVQEPVGLTTLVSLVECAGLAETLDTTFGITVFAPVDDAFKDFDADFLCSEKGLPTLVDVLTYHVVPAVVPSVNVSLVSCLLVNVR